MTPTGSFCAIRQSEILSRGGEKRLGSLAQRLSYAVGQAHLDTVLAGDPSARQAPPAVGESEHKTPWLEIDDVFFEARGYTWALLHTLEALSIDFESVLKDKNALVSLKQIIRELENTQNPIWSPHDPERHRIRSDR
jgi:hypothetical protein